MVAQETASISYTYLLRDDLNFSCIARNKLFDLGDLRNADRIEMVKVPPKKVRAIAIDEDIDKLTKIERNFNEFDARVAANDETINLSNDDERSFDSEASRYNFWKDL